MLVSLLMVSPYLQRTFVFAVVDLILLLTLASAVIASADRRGHAVVGVSLGVLVLITSWLRKFSGFEEVTAAYSILGLLFFSYVTAMVLRDVFRSRRVVSTDTICGALAAYLLLGLIWAFAYALLESLLPGSFEGLREEGYANGYQRFLGYSFVTLTTLGYGNVVPVNARSEALASGEAIIGQVYLTVLIARLVALNLLSERRPERDGQAQKQT